MLYATLEKVQADLVMFSMQTDNKQAKAMYSKNEQRLKDLLDKLRPYLLH